MDCCICDISITGRKPQIIECVSCRGFMHRQCMPTSLSSTEFVRMKKYKEAFNFKCVKCVGGIIVSAEPQQPVKRGRGRPVSFFYFEVVVAMDDGLVLLHKCSRRQ